jgi:hypothetical protein
MCDGFSKPDVAYVGRSVRPGRHVVGEERGGKGESVLAWEGDGDGLDIRG